LAGFSKWREKLWAVEVLFFAKKKTIEISNDKFDFKLPVEKREELVKLKYNAKCHFHLILDIIQSISD
jgi:hypothetical protein